MPAANSIPAYQTSGRPARRRRLRRQRAVGFARSGSGARPAALPPDVYARRPDVKLEQLGKVNNRRGTRCASIPIRRFSARRRISALPACSAWRARRPICSAASRSAGNAPALVEGADTPAEATFRFPGGLKDYLARGSRAKKRSRRPFFGKVERDGGHGSLEWAISWLPADDGFTNSYCNTIPTPDGGTHERASAWRCCAA